MKYRPETEWSFEQAQAEQEELAEDRVHGPAEPLYQWAAMRWLDQYEASYKATRSGFDVLAAVRSCANFDLVMPEWLAYAFCRHYDQVLNCHTDSWDVAFGRPYKRGAHLNAMRTARLGRLQVHIQVVDILARNPETAIDKALFEKIAENKPYSASVAERYYYEALNQLGLHNPKKR